MVNTIQATSITLSNTLIKVSSTPNEHGTTFANRLSESMNASELKGDKANKEGQCCGGGKNKDEASGVKTVG
ncbi:MAG: hypothetical protein COB59_04525 [Rhodospirillaceae bacterium]|nr:MAG: hypothetical protein COB59_04525 [Rhodospirillaceae bacterium]